MIRKTSETRALAGNIVNAYSTSQNSAYSCDYLNDCNTYSTSETFTGKYWVDGKPIYRSTYTGTTSSTGATTLNTSIDSLVAEGGYATYNSNYQFPVPSSFGTDGKNDIRIIKTPAGTLSFQYGTALYNGAYVVWVEYTKN